MLLFFILFVPLFVLILLGIHMLVATSNPDPAKIAPYECGFSSFSDARQKFQISFFLVAILFLVFDCEILFLYPLVVSLYHVSSFGFWIAMVFILLLTIGFVYELGKGALDYAKDSSSSKNSPRAKLPTGTRSYSTSSEFTSDGKRRREKGNPKYTREYKTNLSLSPFQAELLVGLLLGDACIQARVSKLGGHRLTIRHSMEQHDYLQHLHKLFEELVLQPLHLSSSFDRRTGKTYHWCNLHTLSFPCFSPYREMFYNKLGAKVVPTNIDKLLTPVGLAYWFSDDGHFHKASNGFYLCSNYFALAEIELLIKVLRANFDLDSRMHKGGIEGQRMIFIPTSQKEKLRALVHPYLHNSFLFKLG